MPRLLHHKRRHSWPYCGPGMNLRERQNLPIITITEPEEDQGQNEAQLESQFLTPVLSADLLEDDAASAGIIRTEPVRTHHRIWSSSKELPAEYQQSVAPGPLRRMIQPPLDRARSLFIAPTTHSVEKNMMISYWMQRLSAHSSLTHGRGRAPPGQRGLVAIERNHRRCHSERPRSWKEPSLTLWTLEEE